MNKEVKIAISVSMGIAIGASVVGKIQEDKLKKVKLMSDKHLELFLMMNQWVKVKQKGKQLSSYFEKNKYKKIAIYGMNYAGKTLLEELNNTNTNVVYGIDRNANALYADIDIVSIDESLKSVDAIVVTAITYFDEIKKKLDEKMNCPIISLEDILYEI